jgi:hypothetical protein
LGDTTDRPVEFEIHLEGRRWTPEEIESKWRQAHETIPERLELIEGKVFLGDEQRITMLGWMLEQLGADVAVQMGDPEVWREAVEEMLQAQNG